MTKKRKEKSKMSFIGNIRKSFKRLSSLRISWYSMGSLRKSIHRISSLRKESILSDKENNENSCKEFLLSIFFLPFRLFFYIVIGKILSYAIKFYNILKENLIKIHMKIYITQNLPHLKKKFSLLHSGFKSEKWYTRYFLLIDISRHLMLNIIVVSLYFNPLIQLIILCLINFSFFLFLIIAKPFKKTWNFMMEIIFESFINCGLICGLSIAILDYNQDWEIRKRMNLGWIIIISIILLQFTIIVNNFRRIILLYYKDFINFIKEKLKK